MLPGALDHHGQVELVRGNQLDLEQLLRWGQQDGLSDLTLSAISRANTAREIAIACSFDQQMLELLFRHARTASASRGNALDGFASSEYSLSPRLSDASTRWRRLSSSISVAASTKNSPWRRYDAIASASCTW